MSDNRDNVDYEKEFNSLEEISYDKIVEILCEENECYMINFQEFKDIFGTGKIYQSVLVRNLTQDTWKSYRAKDQKPEDIESKLYSSIEKITKEKGKEPHFGYIDNDWRFQYHCMIGNNWVTFPPAVEKRMQKEFRESEKRQREFEAQKQAELESTSEEQKTKTLKLDVLDSGELPFEI